jgi:hypothetical protein
MSATETILGAVKAIVSIAYKLTHAALVFMYRVLTLIVGVVFLPGAYIMRGKFLRGLVVTALLIIIAVFTAGLGLIIAYPMALADVATCD